MQWATETPFRKTSAWSSAETVKREFQMRGGVRKVFRKKTVCAFVSECQIQWGVWAEALKVHSKARMARDLSFTGENTNMEPMQVSSEEFRALGAPVARMYGKRDSEKKGKECRRAAIAGCKAVVHGK
jgi:hypothetical protein